MKILHLIMTFETGGAETMLVDIMNKQIKDYEVSLAIMNNSFSENLISEINNKIKIHYINRPRGSYNPYYFLKLNAIIWKEKPDIIHCHNSYFPKYLLYSKKQIFLTVHDIGHTLPHVRNISRIFAISDEVHSDILSRCDNKNVVTVPNGINFDEISPKDSFKDIDIFKIVMVSRLDHQKKGQDILLNAIDIIVNQYKNRNIHVDYIGEGNSLDYLELMVKNLNLHQYITFLGNRSRKYIYSHLHEYDLLIQPSRKEGFGLTVVEGLAAGLIVLVSAQEGPYEIIAEGKYGLFFRNEDVIDCANKILTAMSYSTEKRKEISLLGTQRAMDYSLDNTLNKYSYFYKLTKKEI